MRSSECARVLVGVTAAAALVLLGGCSSPPAEETPPTTPGVSIAQSRTPAECTVEGTVATGQSASAAALRESAESGPFYSAAVSRSTRTACSITADGDSLTVTYGFADGSMLRVTRDSTIEYSDQEATFAAPPSEDAVALLRRAEMSAFGADGCGIDWQRPSAAKAADAGAVTETTYRGELCNCQARVRSDGAGGTIGLIFRSSC